METARSLDALLPLVFQELRRLARFHLRDERPDHTLQSGALVNEAYLRLLGQNPPHVTKRSQFFAIAGHLMRQILVDYARRHRAEKRGGRVETVSLEDTGIEESLGDSEEHGCGGARRRADGAGADRRTEGAGGRTALFCGDEFRRNR